MWNCKIMLGCSTHNNVLTDMKGLFFSLRLFFPVNSGGSPLSTYRHAECCLDLTLQVCGTSVEQLACQQAERQSPVQPHGAYTLWRWEHSVCLHMRCEQGKQQEKLTPQNLPKLYYHSVVVFLLVILLLYDLVYILL